MSNVQRFHSEWCDRMNGGPECNCEAGDSVSAGIAQASEVKRLNFNVSPRAYSELSSLAKDTHRSMTEVIRLGVGLVKIALDASRDGNKILIVSAGGEPVKEIVIPG